MRVAVAAVFATACLVTAAVAQTYPAKPIRFIVPFPPGGGSDLVARTVAAKLTEALGQAVVVDHRAGAAGTIGADVAARSPADGHTLLLGSNGPLAINPTLYAKLPYDAVRDFAPVSLVTVMPFVRVTHPSLPVKSVKRSSLLPELPTVAEAGVPGYEASGWFGVLVPAGTPQAVVERLNSATVKGLASPDARERLGALGGDIAAGTPEQFAAHIRTEAAKWSKLIRMLGLKAES